MLALLIRVCNPNLLFIYHHHATRDHVAPVTATNAAWVRSPFKPNPLPNMLADRINNLLVN